MTNSVQKRFDEPSKLFIWAFSIGNYFRGKSYYDKLLTEMNIQGNETILEFGSGVGSLSKKILPNLQMGGKLYCIDVSKKLIDHTKSKLQKFSNVEYIHGNIVENTTLANNSFDVIVSTWVLHHVDREILQDTLSKLAELLKTNGKAFIIEFPDSKYNHTKLSEKDLQNLFAKSNFKVSIVFRKKQGILYQLTKQ